MMMTMANPTSDKINIVSLSMNVERTIMLSDNEINTYDAAEKIFRDEIGNKDREQFVVLCLNTKARPTHFEVVHIGTLNKTIIHPREVFKIAILSNAHSIIIGHNHPSNNLEPSYNDIKITESLVKAGKILDIPVWDHIIVSTGISISLREKYEYVFRGV